VEYDASMKYGLLLIILCGSIAQAQVYRTVDQNGNIIYSDVESDNAEEVIIDVTPSYTTPTLVAPFSNGAEDPTYEGDPAEENLEDKVIAIPKYQVTITNPAQNESFQNPESITVTANISPVLNVMRADKLVFKLDGKIMGAAQASTSITLTELERGSHILLVSIVDKTGKVIKKSKSVLFHVHRRSISQ